MTVTNTASGTNVEEVGEGLYRIDTPVEIPGGAFSFNQYLLVDEEPLLFHTGGRRLFPLVSEAIASVLPVDRLRWIGFSALGERRVGRSTSSSARPRTPSLSADASMP